MGTGTVALQKKPRPLADEAASQAPPAFDRDLILERLFALPVPPSPRGGRDGRTYPIHTPLGRIMRLKGLTKREVSEGEGCPDSRAMTEVLAGRLNVGNWRMPLARKLGVDPRVL